MLVDGEGIYNTDRKYNMTVQLQHKASSNEWNSELRQEQYQYLQTKNVMCKAHTIATGSTLRQQTRVINCSDQSARFIQMDGIQN